MKAILFDAGGTLLEINPSPKEIYIAIFEQMGVDIGRERLIDTIIDVKKHLDNSFGHSPVEKDSFPIRFNKLLLEGCGLRCDSNTARQVTIEFANRIRFTNYPETRMVLERLWGRFRLGIISNWNMDRDLNDVLRENNILKYFDYTLASKDFGLEKPDQAIFERALCDMKVDAEDSFYIGDSYIEDVHGALNAGLRPIFVNRRSEPNPLCIPSISTLDEVLAMV